MYALEDFDPETGQAAKTVIFTKRVITTRQPPERASDPADAAAICLDRAGEIRLEDAARLLGSASAGEARTALGELVYDEPGTGRLVPAAKILAAKFAPSSATPSRPPGTTRGSRSTSPHCAAHCRPTWGQGRSTPGSARPGSIRVTSSRDCGRSWKTRR